MYPFEFGPVYALLIHDPQIEIADSARKEKVMGNGEKPYRYIWASEKNA